MMRPSSCWITVLAAAAMLDCDYAHAQARGPGAEDIQQNGQFVGSNYRPPTRLVGGWREVPIGEPMVDAETSALGTPGELDEATRAAQVALLQAWLQRLPGRFRIDGRIEKPGRATMDIAGANGAFESTQIQKTLSGAVTGIAECGSIGEGVGVQCVFNAEWPDIDDDMAGIGSRPTDSESLKSLRPAVLFLGLNLDPPGVRSMLVTDDSIAHTWAGKLTDTTLMADRLTDCKGGADIDPITGELFQDADADQQDHRCLQPLEIIAAPDSEVVTIVLRKFRRTPVLSEFLPAGSPRTLTITLTMHRDDEARAEEPMKTKKVR